MRSLSTLLLACSLCCAVFACKSADEQESRPRRIRSSDKDDENAGKPDGERVVAYLEEMADLMESTKDDCDLMAEKLTKFSKTKGKELKKLEARFKEKSKDPAEQKDFEAKYGKRMEEATKRMVGGAMKCMNNEKVMKAMKMED